MTRTRDESRAHAREIHREAFGRMPDGRGVEAIEIANRRGMRLRVLTFGGTIHTLAVPDRGGRYENVVLSYPSLEPYLERTEFFGAIIGRYANRIGGATFDLNGQTHRLAANEGPNILHGGANGFFQAVWSVEAVEGGETPSIALSYRSHDGDQGFPGALDVRVVYRLGRDDSLRITFEATTDATTVVSLTSHPYFNLHGVEPARSVLDHLLLVESDAYTPVDARTIPTGELRSVDGSPFDLRRQRRVGDCVLRQEDPQIAQANGFDHNFVLRGGSSPVPKLAARLTDCASGRVLELLTTEPGLQVYSGQKLGAGAAKTAVRYSASTGLALEPQRFPDAPNRPAFPSAKLEPGEVYRHESLYRFSVLG